MRFGIKNLQNSFKNIFRATPGEPINGLELIQESRAFPKLVEQVPRKKAF